MDLLDLAVKIGVEDNASSKVGSISSGITSTLSSAVKTGAVATGAAVAAAATGVAALTTQATQAYATYEQMTGGVAKLYGNAGQTLEEFAAANNQSADEAASAWERNNAAQATVMANAQNAWKTTGLSANDYMETATQFSASLISSLGGDTQAAADLTQTAMEAMSDNVNTFGTNFEDVSNAFKGFSKQNYTMLDNLKLGYGGTQSEMERLISDANEYAASIGESSDLTIDSFADQVKAIQLIQQKQQIAGTTAKEASTTIEGSVAAAKAAWENFAVALSGDTLDLDSIRESFGTLNEAVGTAASNIVPKVAEVLTNIGNLLGTGMPTTLENIGAAIEQYAPQLQAALSSLLNGIGDFFSTAGPAIAESAGAALGEAIGELPSIAQDYIPGAIQTIGEIMQGFISGIFPDSLADPLNEQVATVFGGLSDAASPALSWFSETAPTLVGSACDTIGGAFQSFSDVAGPIFEGINTVISDAFSWLTGEGSGQVAVTIDSIGAYFETFATSVQTALSPVSDYISGAFSSLGEGGVGETLNTALSGIQTLFENLSTVVETAGTTIGGILDGFIDGFTSAFGESTQSAIQTLLDKFNGAGDTISGFWETAQPVLTTVADILGSTLATAITLAVDAFSAVVTIVQSVIDGFTNFATTLSNVPSLVETVITNIGTFFSTLPETIAGFLASVITNVQTWVTDMGTKAAEAATSFLNSLTSGFDSVLSWAGGIGGSILSAVGDLGNLLWSAGASIMQGFLNGLKSFWSDVTGWISGVAEWIAANKGPIDYDRQLLIPHGKAIMEGFGEGLETGFSGVQEYVSAMADDLSDSMPDIDLGSSLKGVTEKGGWSELFSNGGSISVYNLTIDGARVNQDVASLTGDYLLELARIGAL